MAISRLVSALCLAAAIGLTASEAFAADGDGPYGWDNEVRKMADKNGMVSKKEFMAMVERKFDAMDKQKKGMLSQADVMKIFRENTGQ